MWKAGVWRIRGWFVVLGFLAFLMVRCELGTAPSAPLVILPLQSGNWWEYQLVRRGSLDDPSIPLQIRWEVKGVIPDHHGRRAIAVVERYQRGEERWEDTTFWTLVQGVIWQYVDFPWLSDGQREGQWRMVIHPTLPGWHHRREQLKVDTLRIEVTDYRGEVIARYPIVIDSLITAARYEGWEYVTFADTTALALRVRNVVKVVVRVITRRRVLHRCWAQRTTWWFVRDIGVVQFARAGEDRFEWVEDEVLVKTCNRHWEQGNIWSLQRYNVRSP